MDIKADRAEVIDKLIENKDRHEATAAAAKAAYREAVIAALREQHDAVVDGKDVDRNFLNKLPPPRDYTKEYDDAIELLHWHIDETIDLQMHEFLNYILDQWSWKDSFTQTTSQYIGFDR